MKKTLNNKNYCRVLVFNPYKKLVAVFHSLTAAANSFGTTNSSIHQACVGPCISSCGHYFRFLNDDIELEWSDLGTLKLEDYDEMCGISRSYYPTSSMSRKGMKYKQTPKNEN